MKFQELNMRIEDGPGAMSDESDDETCNIENVYFAVVVSEVLVVFRASR